MPRRAEDTRHKLIRAAEELFAERGVGAASLREINRHAGQRNATALQYHFVNRAGLVSAVLAKHRDDVESRRHAMLDRYDAAPADLRALAAALVVPEAEKLEDPDGGPEYLRIMAQLLQRPDFPFDPSAPHSPHRSIHRWRHLVARWVPELAIQQLHRRFAAIRIMYVELGRRAETPRRRDHRLFVSHLIDLITAILAAPVSAETDALVRDRRAPRA